MRVWAFPWIYPYDRPGMKYSGIFAHRQYKGLIENGAELTVVLPMPWRPPYPFSQLHPEWKRYGELAFPRSRIYDGITVYYPSVPNIKPSRFVKKQYAERYIDTICKFFKQKEIRLQRDTDIFYSQWLPGSAMVQQAAHRLGVKSAILSIGDDVVVYPNEKKESYDSFKATIEQADLRFVCADYLGKETNRLIGRDLPYTVVHWGADYNFFKPAPAKDIAAIKKNYNIPADKIILLTIGSPIRRKGWLDLFDALVEVKKTNADFLLVGVASGPKDIDVDEEVKMRGLTAYFLNMGEIAPESLNVLYNVADIFCLPSHWEGLANVVVEAMSSGLPVITTNVCGHPEIIDSGANGILIPPHEPKFLAKEITALIENGKERARLGENARNFIVHKWGNFADNAKSLYKKLSGNE